MLCTLFYSVHDIRTGRQIHTLEGHKVSLVHHTFHVAHLFMIEWKQHCQATSPSIVAQQGSVQCLQFDDLKIVSGSWDTTCIVSGLWEPCIPMCVQCLPKHSICNSIKGERDTLPLPQGREGGKGGGGGGLHAHITIILS